MSPTPDLAPRVAAERATDPEITAAITQLLATKKGVAPHRISVATHEGVVALTGFTDSLLAQQRAEEIALAVRGVRGVSSLPTVRVASVPDYVLKRDVDRALADDPATSHYAVRTAVQRGAATLTGSVQSWTEKELVLRVVRGVRGVRRIVADDLRIGGELRNSDAEVTTQIRELLDWDIRLNGALLRVRTTDHVVHLSGTVGTAAEKVRIEVIAYQAGATRVEAHELVVAYWALGREIRREKFTGRADSAIADAVRAVLHHNPRLPATELLVQVQDGTVTLAGTVSNLRARQEAEQDAAHVVGVGQVRNLLKIRTERLVPDETIGLAIGAALGRDPYVGRFQFSVQVRQGLALLQGRVNTSFEQERASDVAAGVNGVTAVDNRVTVATQAGTDDARPAEAAPHPAPDASSDHALASRIRERYYWSARLHDQDVEVCVARGRATLTGTVDTWLDRKQAALEAYEVGARDVNNHLRILTEPADSAAVAAP